MMLSGSRLSSILLTIMLLINLAIVALPVINAQTVPRGPWLDEVVFIEEPDPAKAVERLVKEDIHVYFSHVTDPELFKTVKEKLAYDFAYGLYYELTFNPVGPEFPRPKAGVVFNPFSNPRVREAMNYIVDRDYIANEILGGLAVPRYVALTPSFPDYGKYADVALEIENEYRYDFDKGRSIIYEEMIKMGAELRDGKWYYKGQPVKLIFLIRVEDARKPVGDYIASQVEKLGFIVEKVYGRAAELAPLWLRGDPAEGRWHLYTGAWITTIIARDESGNFGFFYTKLGRPEPLWQAYVNDPEFYVVAERLWRGDYRSMDERDELMRRALQLSMKESQRIWLVHLTSLWARRPDVVLAHDLAGGYSGSALWPYTIRFVDKIGGTMRVGLSAVLVQPWNPIGGSNWAMDQAVIRATGEPAVVPDPYTGLYHPLRVKKAEVYVVKELEGQIRATLPWVELRFVDEITVPKDAWLKFDSTKNVIETVPENTKAKVKVVVYYQDNLFKDYKWHDGSLFSIGDLVYAFLIAFDRANPASPLFDEAYIPSFEAWFAMFRGFKIVSRDPLVIEYYTDTWYMDAEWIARDAANTFWPYYGQGPGAWHVVAVTARAEAEGRVAFTTHKSEKLKVEWANLIAGPTLSILAETLDKCIKEGYLPYEPVLGKYVSKDEVATRYQNLKKWYQTYGHFWVGNGPFFLKSVDVVAKILVVSANREYIDYADRWAIFVKPPVPEAKLVLPDVIYPGATTEIRVIITVAGKPYKVEHIDFVKYVIRHTGGTLSGYAKCVKDGECVVTLDGTETALLVPGPAEVKAIVVSKLVGIPTLVSGISRVATLVDYIASRLAQSEADMLARLRGLESGLRGEISAHGEKIDALKSELEGIRTMFYVSTVIAIIAIVIAALGFVLRRPRS